MHSLVLERLRITSFADRFVSLKDRESEVLQVFGFGFGTRQISEKIKRTVMTIETHRSNIKEKTGLNTTIQMPRFATLWVEDNR
ncbi:MAG: LuxR C-terminal-related transcriptional regulator [Methylococcaceae bacterium]